MCHQSVGLISRAIEQAGTPTVTISSAWSITASVNPPRSVFTDFPLGHTAGPPDDPDTQLSIARDAMRSALEISESGTIVPLPYEWPVEWKSEARVLRDHRTERFATPQYQAVADREAAIAAHGDEAASGC